MEKGLLTIAEAGEVLGLGETKMKELLRRGELPRVKIGKALRIPATSLQRWIDERTVEAEAALQTAG
jgi:excisionase family DNA binding protein